MLSLRVIELLTILSLSTALLSSLRPTTAVKPPSNNLIEPSLVRSNRIILQAEKSKSQFGSKLLPVYSDEEIDDLYKELNVTRFDLENDVEFQKWQPTKEFFEKFGFQNNTEKYRRKVTDVKIDFYSSYTKPILPQYKTFVADMISVTSIQTVDSRYKYDALHAFGLCTQYYTVMKGYPLQEEIDVIFNEFTKAVGLDATKLREDAKRLLNFIKESNLTEEDILGNKDSSNELQTIFNDVRKNRFFKYTDAWGVGLGRVMELVGVEPNSATFERWAKSLRWIFVPRITQTWDEFCGDQIRMQGIESMQKQLLIREKKRAASRLEKKASEFEDKKKALIELNESLEERRKQLLDEQIASKKKYDPDAYERILLEESKN